MSPERSVTYVSGRSLCPTRFAAAILGSATFPQIDVCGVSQNATLVLIEHHRPTLSVVIPARNAAATLGRCLAALTASSTPPLECLVVDDGSSDASAAVARQFGARVLATNAGRRGPAAARNLGASQARGDILLFLDADVCVQSETLVRIANGFAANPATHALIGSYDDRPVETNFCSQYRNLMHCFVHQTGRSDATTFWTGCGAIRRKTFAENGGFDERHRVPSMEDVELGYRLTQNGCRITLDRSIQVTHAKKWTVFSMLKTDILNRGIPWTRLILRYRKMPNDLNLKWSQRGSVLAAWLIFILVLIVLVRASVSAGATSLSDVWLRAMLFAAAIAFVALNLPFYRFLAERRGLHFPGLVIPLHLCFHLLNGVAFVAGILLHACSEMMGRLSVVPAESG